MLVESRHASFSPLVGANDYDSGPKRCHLNKRFAPLPRSTHRAVPSPPRPVRPATTARPPHTSAQIHSRADDRDEDRQGVVAFRQRTDPGQQEHDAKQPERRGHGQTPGCPECRIAMTSSTGFIVPPRTSRSSDPCSRLTISIKARMANP